jgi:sulfur carrier protein ThiS adenylyltransferase
MPTFDQIKSKLHQYTVGIAGAGGLGSNIAMALTRVGIGKLIIADFDIVSESNLNRQFYFKDQLNRKKVEALKENLHRINQDVTIEIHDILLDKDNLFQIFSMVDVMVEAFDKADMKELIIELFQTEKPDMPLVVGNGMAGWGKSNLMNVQKLGNLYICGDNVTEIGPEMPPMAPRVGICAAMQANTVMTILLENHFSNESDPKP